MNGLRTFILLFCVALANVSPLSAQTFPAQNNTRVVDAASILTPAEEAALDTKLAAYQTETGRQMVIATIASLEGYPIEDYGYRLGRAWALGDKDRDDGTLLLVARNDRKVRIEVGYGLEPLLTDGMSSVIINTQIVPRFKEDDFYGGINAGTDAIITQLKLTPEEAAKRAKEAVENAQAAESIGTIIFCVFILLFFVLPMFFGRGKRGSRYGNGPVIIWGGGDSSGGWSSGGSSSWGGGGGFSGGGGSFGGGGASGDW